MSVSIDGAGSLIGVDQGLNIVGLTTLTGGIILDDSISHIGDADTKIRFPAADTFTVETAGNEAIRVDSSGNVGIATANPTTALEVKGDVTIYNANNQGDIFFGEHGDVSDSKALIRMDQINATAGQLQFHTEASGTLSERLRITSAGTLESYSPDDTTPNIKWRSNDTNWYGSLNQSVEGATITTFLSCGGDWSANGTTYSATKALAAYPTSAIAIHNQYNNTWGSQFSFLSKAGGSTTTDGTVSERLRIDSVGKILIGPGAIANPKVTTVGAIDTSNSDWAIVMGGSGSGNRANNATKDGRFAGAHYTNAEEPIGLVRSYSTSSANEVHIGGGSSLINAATQLSFYTATNTTTTGGTERLRITSTGVIQCGTSATLKAEINNSVSGHQFISQCSDNNNGFEVYQQHGSNTTRNTFAVYANTGSSNAKNLQFAVRGDGVVTKPDQPLAIMGTTQNNWSPSSGDVLPFNYSNTNRGNHYNTSNYTFTCPVAGDYMVILRISRKGFRGDIELAKNNAQYALLEFRETGRNDSNAADWQAWCYDFIVPCAANDTLKWKAPNVYTGTGGGNYLLDGYNHIYYDSVTYYLMG